LKSTFQSLTPEDLLGYHHQTALLESVGWDEEQFSKLVNHVMDYLNNPNRTQVTKDDITILLLNVEDMWGPDSKEVLKSIFNIETFYLNLNIQRSQDVN